MSTDDTMNVPYVLLAVIFVVDVLYITNALFIRSLRVLLDKDYVLRRAQIKMKKKWKKEHLDHKKQLEEEAKEEAERAADSHEHDNDDHDGDPHNDDHAGAHDHPNHGHGHKRHTNKHHGPQTPDEAKKLSQQDKKWTPKTKTAKFVLLAVFFGSVSKDHTISTRFPAYRPIPLKLGVVLTQVLILGSAGLLSPQLMGNEFSAPTDPKSLCSNFDKLSKLQEFRTRVDTIMNVDQAVDQHNHAWGMLRALQNDTALYGTIYSEKGGAGSKYDFTCEDGEAPYSPKGEKDLYDASEVRAAFGTFFPGFCQAFRSGEEFSHLLTTCDEVKCTEPDPSLFGDLGEAAIRSKIVQNNLHVCLRYPAPCPDLTASNEAASTNEDFNQQQLEQANTVNANDSLESTATLSASDEDDGYQTETSSAPAVINKLLNQFDMGSNLYVIYSCFRLLFPPPINLFKPPLTKIVKTIFLGQNKFIFIFLVVGVWWGIDYYKDILFNPDVKLYLMNSVRDPCFIDADFIQERQTYFTERCNLVTVMGPNFDNAVTGINNIIETVPYFTTKSPECCGFFPFIHSEDYTEAATESKFSVEGDAYIEEMGFTTKSTAGMMCLADKTTCYQILHPPRETLYVGNATICESKEESRALIYEAAVSQDRRQLEASFVQIWLRSGLLASFLVKIFVANFGLNLLYVADPLIKVGGCYEYPDPRRYKVTVPLNFDDIRDEKEYAIRLDSIKNAAINGLLANACIGNLIWLTWDQLNLATFDYTNPQIMLATCILMLGAILVVTSITSTFRVKSVEYRMYSQGRLDLQRGRKQIRRYKRAVADDHGHTNNGGSEAIVNT